MCDKNICNCTRVKVRVEQEEAGQKDTAETRLRNVEKEMNVHAKALYEAWAAIPALHNEYLAIIAGKLTRDLNLMHEKLK